MSSPSKEIEEPTSSGLPEDNGHNGQSGSGVETVASSEPRPPAKRPISHAVIEISDTESDDSDICAVTTYQATADEVKRIRGADYSSSSSSSSDYSSDSESPWEDDSVVIQDVKITKKAVKTNLYPRANRMEDPKLNSQLQSQELIDRLKSNWHDCKDMKSEELTLTSEPFRVCLLHNFLSNPDIINNIVDDMNTLDWSRKKMDLYEFHQTTDLASLTWQRSIRGIYELLKMELMSWVSQVTGLQLTSVSASCSLYGPGDHLLVHDDLLGDRRVAFILYLAPWQPEPPPLTSVPVENGGGDNHVNQRPGGGWSPHMGGALQLLSRDEAGPGEVTRSICPQNNMLAFFQVGPESFHQVEEVLSMELPRLSINGWFHGPAPGPGPGLGSGPEAPVPEPEQPLPVAPEPLKPHNEVVLLQSWIDAAYLSPRLRAAVQAHMERESEACLRALLPGGRLRAVLAGLAARAPGPAWRRAGPPNHRRHDVIRPGDLPPDHAAQQLLHLFASAAFCRMLHDCTDLVIRTYESLELQRWRAGDFTLLPPRSRYQTPRLEAVLYLGVPERSLCGGATTFLAPEEGGTDQSLVTLPPDNNALGLVYCDAGAASFTKYLSRLTMPPDECFYILTCTYKE